MLYLELFLTFFKIGLFTIGGGYAMLPLIQADVQAKGWMTAEELVNFIAVNPVEGSGFRRPESAHMQALITILRRRGTVATLRDSAAQDIEGGCGQLRARVIGIRKEQA